MENSTLIVRVFSSFEKSGDIFFSALQEQFMCEQPILNNGPLLNINFVAAVLTRMQQNSCDYALVNGKSAIWISREKFNTGLFL